MPSQVANNAQWADFVERITAQGWNIETRFQIMIRRFLPIVERITAQGCQQNRADRFPTTTSMFELSPRRLLVEHVDPNSERQEAQHVAVS